MKYSKTFFLIGVVLIILPFTGFSLAWKNWITVALGVWVVLIALLEQITSVARDRESSYKKVSVKSGSVSEEDNISSEKVGQ